MKLTFISDTHFKHAAIDLPGGDILVHCGDFTYNGSFKSVKRFAKWLSEQEYEHKVFIAGNHDDRLQTKTCREILPNYLRNNTTYLQDSSVTIEGLKFYGSPWTPVFGDWAFMLNQIDLKPIWARIPLDTDILVTHGPPWGILDCIIGQTANLGDVDLMMAVDRIQPFIHAFGHIHTGRGVKELTNTTFINASLLDERLGYTQEHISLSIEKHNGKWAIMDYLI